MKTVTLVLTEEQAKHLKDLLACDIDRVNDNNQGREWDEELKMLDALEDAVILALKENS